MFSNFEYELLKIKISTLIVLFVSKERLPTILVHYNKDRCPTKLVQFEKSMNNLSFFIHFTLAIKYYYLSLNVFFTVLYSKVNIVKLNLLFIIF